MHKILIVDDEAYIRELLAEIIEEFEEDHPELSFELQTAQDGEAALDIIQQHQPDLVFLDVMMPKMNGFEVCKSIKQDMQLDNVYVVMLTAKGQPYDKERGLDVGADVYLTKPFTFETILATLENHFT